jgi:L-fucose isomerase-like protein
LELIRDRNILLWGFPESLRLIRDGHFLGSNSAFTVLRNAMKQMGFHAQSMQEFPGEKACSFIADFVNASATERGLRATKLGLIGYCSMGIYTACFDQLKIRQVFGAEIDASADSYILSERMNHVDEELVRQKARQLQESCRVDEEVVRNGSLDTSLRMFLALKDMSSEGEWKGLSVKCQHELSTYLKCTACLPLSLLTDEGLMCTDEGDVHALLTMTVMHGLAQSSPIYFGDIYKLDEGGFLMSHCGFSPHSCAAPNGGIALLPQAPRISKDGKTTGGIVSSYTFREGEVTIGRIENDREGTYIFHHSKGRIAPVDSIAAGYSSAVFTPEKDDDFFAENQLANHYVFVYEDIESKLQSFCRMKGLRTMNR